MLLSAPASAGPAAADGAPPAARRWWAEGALIVGFWGLLFLLTAVQRSTHSRGPDGIVPIELLDTGLEYALWLLLTPAIFWLSRRFSFERERWRRSLAVHVGVALLVASAMNLFGYFTYFTLIYDGERPFQLTRSLLSLSFLDELVIYLVVLAAGFARDYLLRYRQRQHEASQLRAQTVRLQGQLAEARLQALRMQLNPHFLFNTLHAVSSLAGRDPAGVRRMIARLSELLRYALENSSTHEAPLKDEIQFLSGYLEIQRIRFQGRLEVTIEARADVLDALVPSLILQPLVENAIKHGASQAEGVGHVRVEAYRDGPRLVLRVCDNGPGFDAAAALSSATNGSEGNGSAGAPDGSGLGLRNTRERLTSLYGEDQHFALGRADDGSGFCAEIALPYHTTADLHATALPA